MALPSPTSDTCALVTGASSGIGAELARSLAMRGHNVVIVARRLEKLRSLAAELADRHQVRAEALACDLVDPEARDALPGRIEELGLTVDVLVNNAGYGSAGKFTTLDTASEAAMVRLNCEAVVALCGALVPDMVARGRGAVCNVGSVVAFQPLPAQATYAASKAFVLSFTDSLATELTGTGVSATSLCPGPVETEFAQRAGMTSMYDRLPGLAKVSASDNAEAGVRAMEKGHRAVVPGWGNRISATAGRYTPRQVLLPLVRRLHPYR